MQRSILVSFALAGLAASAAFTGCNRDGAVDGGAY